MTERLVDILKASGSTRVLLVGDFMLDHYTYGNAERLSPEAPVMVLNVTQREERPGGAGSVVSDLAALGAQVRCVGVVGKDSSGQRLRDMLGALPGVRVDGLLMAEDRPTTTKQRIIGLAQHRHRQQLMRIDEEYAAEIPAALQERLKAYVEQALRDCDVVCIEDYNKGVLAPGFCQEIIALARQQQKPVVVDPAAISDYTRYRGVSVIKPNRRELSLATGIKMNGESSWHQAVGEWSQRLDIDAVVVTLDREGAYLYQRNTGNGPQGEQIPTRPRNVYDVTGAGDMMLAMLGLLVGGRYEGLRRPTLAEMVCLANVAGGLEVERFGSVPISREEIIAELLRQRQGQASKLRSLPSLLSELPWHRQQKLRVVFTNGCFDILHPGHIQLLHFAKSQGDILVVAINSDRSVRALKGPSRPILNQQDRAALIAALEVVDYVLIFDEDTPKEIIEQITPDVLIKGTDWQGNVVGQEWVEGHGGKVVLMPLAPGQSTTNIITEVLERYARPNGQTGG